MEQHMLLTEWSIQDLESRARNGRRCTPRDVLRCIATIRRLETMLRRVETAAGLSTRQGT